LETRPCVFARLGLKGGENSSECHESCCGRLSTNGTSTTILKFQFREVCPKLILDRAFSLDLGLKGVKLARNLTKVVVRKFLQMGHPKQCSIFNYEKLVKAETRPYVFGRGENSLEHHENLCGCLSTNGTSKTILKFQFQEIGQSRNATVRFL
jgi:hypothetical protein